MISEEMVCLKWAGDVRWEISARNITWTERSWGNFSSISLPGDDRRGRKKSKKDYSITISQNISWDFFLSFPSTVFVRIYWVLPIASVNRMTSREVGTVSGRTEHRLWVGKEGTGEQGSWTYRSAKEGLWERFGLYRQSLNKLLILLTSKTPVYFLNHPVHRWELSEHLVPSWRSPVYRIFSL